jgi:hypothetical protein
VRRLEKDKFAHMDGKLQTTMIGYFSNLQPTLRNSSDAKFWADDQFALNQLKAMPRQQTPHDDMSKPIDSVPKAQ